MSLFDEEVIPMPPMGVEAIDAIADAFLRELCPSHLIEPGPLAVESMVDIGLEAYGIQFYPTSELELGDREAATDPSDHGDGEIRVLMREDQYDDLFLGAGFRRSHRARATALHELGHCILHVPVIRRRAQIHPGMLNRRTRRKNIPAFKDPEWQAWTFAGCIMFPTRALRLLGPDANNPGCVASFFGASEKFARNHINRLRRAGQIDL